MSYETDDQKPIAIPLPQLKDLAAAVAMELKTVGDGALSEDVRIRFIDTRAELFQRGIYDPVLVRFDSATVPRATNQELGDELALVAESL